MLNEGSRWPRRIVLLAIGVTGGLLVARLFDPAHGELAAEDDMEALIRRTDREPAPSLEGATAWLNTGEPLSIAALKGKVVLMDFWTFG